FGGISVGGMVNNRKLFGTLLAGVDHLPTTYNREHQAFSKGEPDWCWHLADELERIVTLHDASTIAAVIVEPMAGSTGVLPAPKGYLPRLRAICDKHGILLVFDEVITGFGRLGHAFAAERYGVVPDMITFAKGITSGSVPMGGVGLPNVLDGRCVGLTAGIDLASRPGEVGKRAYDAMDKAFREQDLVIRAAGETIVLTPPLIVSEGEIEEMFAKAARVIKTVA